MVTRAIIFSHISSHGGHGGYSGHSRPVTQTQLKCVGGNNNCTFQPTTVQCYNKTSAASPSTWKWQCESTETNMTGLCFNTVTVTCNSSKVNNTGNDEVNNNTATSTATTASPLSGSPASNRSSSKGQDCWMEYTIDKIVVLEWNGTQTYEVVSACAGNHYDVPSGMSGTAVVLLIAGSVIGLCFICFMCECAAKVNEKSEERSSSYWSTESSVNPPTAPELHPLKNKV